MLGPVSRTLFPSIIFFLRLSPCFQVFVILPPPFRFFGFCVAGFGAAGFQNWHLLFLNRPPNSLLFDGLQFGSGTQGVLR